MAKSAVCAAFFLDLLLDLEDGTICPSETSRILQTAQRCWTKDLLSDHWFAEHCLGMHLDRLIDLQIQVTTFHAHESVFTFRIVIQQ